ncbi:MAG: deoxyribonuclease V [Sedimentisphaerales bacterium]|nr:deoxyribonuclease V [Sedimentisphaerales bacterium]
MSTHRFSADKILYAKELQRQLAERVRIEPLSVGKVGLVGGVDVSFPGKGERCLAAAVVLDIETLELVESVWAAGVVEFPYVPGLLSFREAPVMLAALEKLRNRPDVVLVDGQGLAHPRRCGLACHLGVELDIATIGCAKSRLIGVHEEVGEKKGDFAALMDDNEVIGTVLRTRDKVKCLYISVGHRIELGQAVDLTLRCCGRYRLPEPTRRAHQQVTKLRSIVGVDRQDGIM